MENATSKITPADFENFFRTFKASLGNEIKDESRWILFFNRWREFHHSPPKCQIDEKQYLSFFCSLNKPLKEHYQRGLGINVWDVAGVGKDEVRNSAVLAWLLDRNGSHGQKNLFLEGLLNLLAEGKDLPKSAMSNLPPPGSTGDSHYWTKVESHYWANVETMPLCARGNRVDIEIDGPFLLFIEVKINAPETNNQLERYVKIAREKAGSRKWGVVLLTKDKSRPNDTNLHDHVVSISWKQLTASIMKQMKQAEAHIPADSVGYNVISQFCQHLTT